jgi:hypothetical protein
MKKKNDFSILQGFLIVLAVLLLIGAGSMMFGSFGGNSSDTNEGSQPVTDKETTSKVICTNHVMDGGVVVVAATCENKGTKLYSCTKCDFSRFSEIPEGHKWSTDGSGKCTVCGDICSHSDSMVPDVEGGVIVSSTCALCGHVCEHEKVKYFYATDAMGNPTEETIGYECLVCGYYAGA